VAKVMVSMLLILYTQLERKNVYFLLAIIKVATGHIRRFAFATTNIFAIHHLIAEIFLDKKAVQSTVESLRKK
jgi:hypothetical protein